MNIYNNGNANCQAPSSVLKVCLDAWAKRSVCYRSGLVPEYYCSWREWTENAQALRHYVDSNGFPDENSVPEQYDMNREILFHDYMMRNAITRNIEWKMIEFVVESWTRHNCFMNLDVDLIVREIQSYLLGNYSDEEIRDQISFEAAVAAVSNVLGSCCCDKWICKQASGMLDLGYCPQTFQGYECLS